jgi:hypothetical protein
VIRVAVSVEARSAAGIAVGVEKEPDFEVAVGVEARQALGEAVSVEARAAAGVAVDIEAGPTVESRLVRQDQRPELQSASRLDQHLKLRSASRPDQHFGSRSASRGEELGISKTKIANMKKYGLPALSLVAQPESTALFLTGATRVVGALFSRGRPIGAL